MKRNYKIAKIGRMPSHLLKEYYYCYTEIDNKERYLHTDGTERFSCGSSGMFRSVREILSILNKNHTCYKKKPDRYYKTIFKLKERKDGPNQKSYQRRTESRV